MRTVLSGLILALATVFAMPAWAQFGEEATKNTKGPKLDSPLVQKLRVGMTISASGGPVTGVIGTVPVPFDWPEQQVKIVAEDVSPTVKKIQYRMLNGLAKQMLIEVPQLPAGQEAHAIITFEVTRASLLPPDDPKIFHFAEKKQLTKDVLQFLGTSPYIESNNQKIKEAAKEAMADKETAYEKVEAIYDYGQAKIKYQNGPLKGALKAFNEGTGDCEELSSLFIAMCRSQEIPARTVWVPGHCYSEFYLVDDAGKGYWIPCQSAGTRAFGGIPEHRPILQKGDNFHDPDRPKDKLRYVNEYLKAQVKKGGGVPKVSFIEPEIVN